MKLVTSPEYLWIRVLEACNAGCTMCQFARSRDQFRLEPGDLTVMLQQVHSEGVRFVRFTGGEPLMHRGIIQLVQAVSTAGMKCSVVSNGYFLGRRIDDLLAAGLDHLAVSLDGMQKTHDRLRQTPGIFLRAIQGIKMAAERGVMVRVNTVCGPENFREMPALQEMITSVGASQWELSTLKLPRRLQYSTEDKELLDGVVQEVYSDGPARGLVRPMGHVWCGDSGPERMAYLESGIPPRPVGECWLVHKVRYLDPKNGWMWPCPYLPHRRQGQRPAKVLDDLHKFTVLSDDIVEAQTYYSRLGPSICDGCNANARPFSEQVRSVVMNGGNLPDWSI